MRRGRDSKGRFLKKKHHKRTTSGGARKARTVAKRKKRSGGGGGRKTRTVYVKQKRRHRRHGESFALKPSRYQMEQWALAGLYGYLEGKAAADSTFFLHQVPKPIAQIGFVGNVAAVAWVGGSVAKSRWLRRFGDAVAGIAAYQMARHGAQFNTGEDILTLSGPGPMQLGDDASSARLSPERLAQIASAMQDAAVSGVPYEDEVEDPEP
jgi:hypothetical protein